MEFINGDCFDVMGRMESNSCDLVLTDPPFGITCNAWDTPLDNVKFWENIYRVSKPAAPILIFAQEPFGSSLITSNLKHFRYEIIWEKAAPRGFLLAKKRPMRIFEKILVFYRKQPVYNPQMRTGFKPYTHGRREMGSNYHACKTPPDLPRGKGPDTRYPTDVIRFANKTSHFLHPTEKPVKLLEYLITTYSNPCDVVFDPCAGSAPCGTAAFNTGRDFIGVEKDRDYFNIGLNRLRKSAGVIL